MSKHKTQPQSPGKGGAEAHLEDSVEETTLEIFEFIKKYRVVLFLILAALVCWFVLPGVYRSAKENSLRDKNSQIWQVFQSPREQIPGKAEALLADLKGDATEIALAVQYTEWLLNSDASTLPPAEQQANEQKAHKILLDVKGRYPDNLLLEMWETRLKKHMDDNASFTPPAPAPKPEAEGPPVDAPKDSPKNPPVAPPGKESK